jgi:sulfate adenylyltransferase (ADP) / ATP adenylyltransferase
MDDRHLHPEETSLWEKILARTDLALASGALRSIPTTYEIVEIDGISYVLRQLNNLQRKLDAKKKQDEDTKRGVDFNPFLPYEEEMYVADITPTHVCLLNKFNIVDHHILIVTRAFEDQTQLLTLADFEALGLTLAEIDGLAFYNGGPEAGASQKHKHLQVIPLPMAEEVRIPIEPEILKMAIAPNQVFTVPSFSFCHGIMMLDRNSNGHGYYRCYQQLLTFLGLDAVGPVQSGAYNFLCTREWMMLVPRSLPEWNGVEINSLGFAGALLVRNSEQADGLKAIGPMAFLAAVGSSTRRGKGD